MLSTLNELCRWIEEHDDIAVITHFRPDGDAYGCALAMTMALRTLGKKAFPVIDDDVELKFRFLPGSEEITNAQKGLPFVPASVLGVDVSEAERMGKSMELFASVKEQAVIDHHATNTGFAPVTYCEPDAVSAGQLVLKVINALQVELTLPIAQCVYTAIVTDSGNFSFKDTNSQAFLAAAQCIDAGVEVEELTRILFRSRTLAKTRLLGAALNRIVMSPEGKVAGIMLPDSLFEETGAERPDSHSIVNYLNEIDGVNVGILVEQRPEGVKISFRGANGTDVAALAGLFGGGGHIAAAGAIINGAVLENEFDNIMRTAAKYVGEKA